MLEGISIYAIIGSYIASVTKLYLMLMLDGMKEILKNKKFWIAVILSGLYIYLSFLLTDNAIKVILEFVTTIILSLYVLEYEKRTLLKVIINCFIIWVLTLLIDVLFSVAIIKILTIDMEVLKNHEFLKFLFNALVFLILLLFFLNKKIRYFIRKLSITEYDLKNVYVIFVIFISVCFFGISVYLCLFNYNIIIILMTLLVMIALYTIIVIIMIKWFSQKNKIQAEYDILLTNLAEYENLLDIQRIVNHENKNQLLVIKGMINKNDLNIIEYIDSLIDTHYKDNDALIMKTNRIPSGGLKGLVYYKLLMMKDKNIDIYLDVSSRLRNLDFCNISVKINQELCKIVGVFLDNAIQAVETISDKKVIILIDYVDNNLFIKISNTYEGFIELDKMDDKGYTTKGKGHGYGLSLVKSIVKNNDSFSNEKEINGRLFTQIVKLKI